MHRRPLPRRLVPIAASVMWMVVPNPHAFAAQPSTTMLSASVGASPIGITINSGHGITLTASSAHSGKVAFTLTATDRAAHEVDIVRTALAADKLPLRKNGQFDEHSAVLTVVREAVKTIPGKSRSFSAVLSAGHYVIADNIPGHYGHGERTELTITG